MDKACLVRAHMFGQMRQKGDHIVLGHGLDLVDAGNVKLDVLGFPDRLGVFARDHAQIGHGIAGVCLDLVPDAELGLGGPDGDHIGAGIAGDHGQAPLFACVISADGRSHKGQGVAGQRRATQTRRIPRQRTATNKPASASAQSKMPSTRSSRAEPPAASAKSGVIPVHW